MATIIVVEDYPVTQRVLSLTLRNEGHEVILASDGIEALQKLQEHRVDMALVDIAMPEMDGIELLRHIRNDPQLYQLPVVMLTASGQDEDRLVAMSLGANAFLSKPVSSHELAHAVNKFLA